MEKVMKILAFLSLIVFTLIFVLIIFSPYFLNAYKDEIAHRLGAVLHRKVDVQKIGLTIFSGLGLDAKGIKIYNEPGFKKDFFLKIEALNISLAFWPLLQQRVESKAIELKNPQLNFEINHEGFSNLQTLAGEERTNRNQPPDAKPEILPGIAISNLQITNGTISQENDRTNSEVLLKGINIDLNQLDYNPDSTKKNLLEGIKVVGSFNIDEGKLNRFQFENLQGQLSLDKMNLHLKDWVLDSYGGKIKGFLVLNLKENQPRYHLTGHVENLNAQDLLNSTVTEKNLITGALFSDLEIDGSGLKLSEMEKSLSGKGSFTLQNGILKTVNIIKQFSLLSKLNELQPAYKLEETKIVSLKGNIAIDHGKILFKDLKGALAEGELTGEGTLDFHQNIDFKTRIVLNKDESGRLPRNAQLLFVDQNNQAAFPLNIRGTVSSPQVTLETKQIVHRTVQEGIKQGIKSLLDRFAP